MAPLRLEVNFLLTFESALLFGAGALALYDRDLFRSSSCSRRAPTRSWQRL